MPAGRERVQKLMRIMGIEAIYPKKRTNIPDSSHRTYPYLLRGISVIRPNHVWGTDITYVRLEKGFAYLVAILDWFSRYVLAWELSLSLDSAFCLNTLHRALGVAIPDTHNSDQGSQFTALAYTLMLEKANIKISMDGKDRCMDYTNTSRFTTKNANTNHSIIKLLTMYIFKGRAIISIIKSNSLSNQVDAKPLS